MQETEDPYAFGPVLGELDLHLFNEGRHFHLADALGANVATIDGVPGVRFAVWAPNAERVAVIGDFNSWDARRHPMRLRYPSGIWELFVPRAAAGMRYKYDIMGPGGVRQADKADPVAQQAEVAPGTASIVPSPRPFRWTDDKWIAGRAQRQAPQAPLSIYEVHIGSWLRPGEPRGSLWDLAVERLIPYVVELGFTHVELLPITEHPFGGSWGYQPLGLFAPSARFGPPEAFARFVDALHANNIGLLLDWVPAHFPTDPHGLARFDGTALYEHLDPREGFHRDWNTYIYNFGRREVQGFLIASALHWLERYHVDGLRVDAVASMLYRDYSRPADAWIPNVYGGRENLEAVGFLRHLNAVVAERCPGAIVVAEEFDGLARRHPGAARWAGLLLQVEHGLDARHAALHRARAHPSRLPPRRHHLRPALRLLGEVHPADLARRGRARQRLAAGQDAGRPLAALRQPARLSRLHVGPSRQEAAVHGLRDRPAARMEPRRRARLGPARRSRPMPASSGWCATSTGSTRRSPPCIGATPSPRASAG